MEISTDGYLHKKFKKQLYSDPIQIIAKEQNVVKCIPSKPYNETIPVIKNTNDVVPNFSTNNENVFLAAKSSISHIRNNLDGIEGLGNPQSFNNCISYVISNSDNNRVEDINQQDTQNRPVNFDRKFNVLETIAIPKVETSSILDNVYSKQYVTSKLVSLENIGDISATSSNSITHNNEHGPNVFDDSSCPYERNIDNQPPELGILEKSSGGKYVCSYCNLACSKPSVLQKHIRAHTNERPYPCVSCGFSFKTRSNLYKHCRSRTHANRVMGNKAQETQFDGDSDSQSKSEYVDDSITERSPPRSLDILTIGENKQVPSQDLKAKPYKPRFHTAKEFFEESKDDKVLEDQRVPETLQNMPPNSQLLSLHINDVINKNNAIVNSGVLKKRSTETDNHVSELPQRTHESHPSTRFEEKRNEEPLNLTNKIRKRCISEVTEPAIHTSLIKELLLKNLYADPNMQCPHCKMIFQTVTELELHKMRSCKAFIKSGARYSRSSSVNVASILTKNKNAFDNMPPLQNTIFPLKSPGPCLGKTRLVENDNKAKSFSFDDSLPVFRNNFNTQDILKSTLRSSITPLTIPQDRIKKIPVKLFGGEVKITHTSGESKSFKIDNKECSNFADYSSKLSENRVVKSSLQSGGTVLQNKPNYNSKQDSLSPSSNVLRVYENNTLSPSIDITTLDKPKFNFDRVSNTDLSESKELLVTTSNEANTPLNYATLNSMNSYTNMMDFSQKAAKLLVPNLRQPNLTIPGIPIPSTALTHSPSLNFEPTQNIPKVFESNIKNEHPTQPRENNHTQHIENMQFAQNQIFLQQKMALDLPPLSNQHQNICNPVNLLVDGKVVRYVPGIPGPVATEMPLDVPYATNHTPTSSTRFSFGETPLLHSPKPLVVPEKQIQSPRPDCGSPSLSSKLQVESDSISKSPRLLEVRTSELPPPKLNELRSPSNLKSPTTKNLSVMSSETTRKFARPNTLALKPTTASQKQHHGLTPTMFNQILISPDTPRVAKKYMQHFLHGNYFSYLGLKSSTKAVYCTLNKTQPTYVPHFKKLSMYSEWRQQETKGDKHYASAYDSRQKKHRYSTAGKTSADLIVHSSYTFTATEGSLSKEDDKASSNLGYESNDEYTYIRGRGRGRYVCDQCGIRCKKPSMLKKHIRTHSNDRPYTCSHCNFSFKTKGNLTKHMKSKAHTKNYAASGSSNSSAHQSGTQSSESDTDDSGLDSSDESTRQQEHEAAYGLLSLSQKTSQNITMNSQVENTFSGSFMNAEQVTQVNNTNFAKNKILDKQVTINFNVCNAVNDGTTNIIQNDKQNFAQFLGKPNGSRPLTYPYTSDIIKDHCLSSDTTEYDDSVRNQTDSSDSSLTLLTKTRHSSTTSIMSDSHYTPTVENSIQSQNIVPVVKVNDTVIVGISTFSGDTSRKRKIQEVDDNEYSAISANLEAIDLSMTSAQSTSSYNDSSKTNEFRHENLEDLPENLKYRNFKGFDSFNRQNGCIRKISREHKDIITETPLRTSNIQEHDHLNINYISPENNATVVSQNTEVQNSFSPMDYDNSAMETLADVATKQVKLEKHILAKNVASEFLKIASKKDDSGDNHFLSASPQRVNELLGKSDEEDKSCTICDKNFSKPSQLRLHMNIHYLERPFRCEPCETSFRTKGHLQKHERSAGHHNKLSSPLLSSTEPRPFKCTDCKVGFRIHGHLAKHLRSKQHIMKLEWLAKIPIGLYAELERSNSLLTEINTTDGDQCLESLKTLARKVFVNVTSKPNQTNLSPTITEASDS